MKLNPKKLLMNLPVCLMVGLRMNRQWFPIQMLSNPLIGMCSILTENIQSFFFVSFLLCRDDDIDGTWEAPSIDNPRCQDAPGCGKWSAPTIPNPLYKGIWRAPLVDNPNYSVRSFSCQSTCNILLFFLGSMGTTQDPQSRLFRRKSSI